MIRQKISMPLLGFRNEKGAEPPLTTTPVHLLHRRASAVRLAFSKDSIDPELRSPKLRSPPSASTRLLSRASKVGLRSLDTSSNSSLRPLSKISPKLHGPSVQLTKKVPTPLKLDERDTVYYPEEPLSPREPASPSYEKQFRRSHGDLLHRFDKSVPYMQSYGPTSLQCDALTTRLLEFLCEPGTPCFYQFPNKAVVTTVLDLGCGPQLLWATTAARFWPNAKIIGIDCIRPNPEIRIPSNVEFLQQNLLDKLSTIKTESVDFIRMSCLGTSIPEQDWPVVLTEVRRTLKPGGVVEIIDDELYPEYLHEVDRGRVSGTFTGGRGEKDNLHPIDRDFRKMLEGYHMSKAPHKTIESAMGIAFVTNEMKCFRVELPSPNIATGGTRRGGNVLQTFLGKRDAAKPVPRYTPAKAQRILGLDKGSARGEGRNPSLIFQPYRQCHLDTSEVRMVACGTMHKVLSCRASLIDFIVPPGREDRELGKVTDLLWEYEESYQKMLNLPQDDWDDLCGEYKESGKEFLPIRRTSTDSCDSGYASPSYNATKTLKGKASTSFTPENNNGTLVRRFWVFHATKV